MSETEQRAIEILRRDGPMLGSNLGWQLWGETTEYPDRGEGSHGNNKFCRPAGKILRSLERQGKVVSQSDIGRTLWRAL